MPVEPRPPRSWTRPDRYAGEEAKTPTSTVTRQVWESLVPVYDRLDPQDRLDLAEIGGRVRRSRGLRPRDAPPRPGCRALPEPEPEIDVIIE